MELIGMVLLFIVVNVFKAVNKAQKQQTQQKQPPRRTPGYSPRPAGSAPPRRRLEDIVGQMMEAVGLEDADDDAPAEAGYEAYGAYGDGFEGVPTSYVPPEALGEGISRRDALGCVGGTLAHDLHEGEEFPGHLHANPEPLAVAEPLAVHAQEPAGIRARLTGGQARYAMVMTEVLGRPVSMRSSMRRGGVRY